MASHHHLDCDCRRLHHRESNPHIPAYYTTSSPCFCADSTPCCTQCSPPDLDHLLRLIASYLQNQQPCCETASTRFNAVKRQRFVNQQNTQREYENILRKINDLDLSLNRFPARRESYSTLKDSAARVIQTHFRSYLVRRSVSLRQLKELTRIESSFASLRSWVSGKTHFPLEAVSREATHLLLRLDFIKGSADSMIRDGKRTLCRDLVRFLHYVGDCAVRRRNVVSKYAKDVTFGAKRQDRSTEMLKKHIRRIYVSDEENIAELEEFRFVSDEIPIVSVGKSRKLGVESGRGNKVKTPVVYELASSAEDDDGVEILMMSGDNGVGISSRSRRGVVKNVSFNENGNVYKVYGDTPEASGGDDGSTSGSNNESGGDGYTEVENIKYMPKEHDRFKEEGEESLSENEEESSSQGSKGEVQVSGNVSHKFHLGKGSLMISPLLPLKMEP
ncbi:unnamed protein product [Brassica oleracea]|uniref:BAG domain-containing protein n=1 Tax=Brassica oleracea var. oleracea TaxID=109376 RepID=A0A0D2ZQD5_BRAOL|nr:PREDICTED: BAG family molecular chaperone regulator 8, chloroplastic-like [Brassica oleracea var. oleracea]